MTSAVSKLFKKDMHLFALIIMNMQYFVILSLVLHFEMQRVFSPFRERYAGFIFFLVSVFAQYSNI